MFFPSILAGPSYTYRSYDSFTSKRLFLKETSTTSIPDNLTSKDIPAGRKRKAAKRFITALIFLGVYSTYGGQYGMDKLLEGKFVAQRSLLQR
jgi:lysophospholipid acyltransferase